MAGYPLPEDVALAASSIGLSLSVHQSERLAAFTSLLERRAVPLGFIARRDAGRVFERHVLDSLRAVPALAGDHLAYDLGSGAGLPGVVVAVALPDCRVALVEPNARKAAFLELALERLRISNADVAVARAEALGGPADAVTARAFAPLERSWKAAAPLLRPGGKLIYFAGEGLREPERVAAELEDPETPAAVQISRPLATATPLVIITRG